MRQQRTKPTVELVEETPRPILIEPVGFFPRKGHRPVLRNGELAAACDHPMSHLEVVDHFENRVGTEPCPRCFRHGFPFTYDVEQIGPYGDLGPNETIEVKKFDIPDELLPDGDVFLGEIDE